MPEFSYIDVTWFAQAPWIPTLMGWSTLFFEAFYPVLVFFYRTRVVCVLAIIGMHGTVWACC